MGPEELNYRIRNGNGCFLLGIDTPNLQKLIFQITTLRKKTFKSGQADWQISTAKLKASRLLHTQPINLVVYKVPISRTSREGMSVLEVGLALICLQRLSRPNIATQLLPLAEQLEHQRSVSPGPLVLRRAPRQTSCAHIR